MEDVSLLDQNLELQQMLLDDKGECTTIEVIFPEGCTSVPPLVSEIDTLISLENLSEEIIEEPTIKKSTKKNLPYAEYWTSAGYCCPNCAKCYNARKNLARHINRECGKEPQYMCPYCQYKNHRRNEIKKHMRNKHSILIL